jgi:hypothetical protein
MVVDQDDFKNIAGEIPGDLGADSPDMIGQGFRTAEGWNDNRESGPGWRCFCQWI